jgi:hypothetical protein
MTPTVSAPVVCAVLRLIDACQDREALLIVADHLTEAATESAAAGVSNATLRALSAAARTQSTLIPGEPK